MRRVPMTSASSRGFALVGVVMFVLVLTILGLSLFSLSSIEGQFLNQSTSRAEAFYAASEGLERARFVLATTDSLDSVASWLEVGGTIAYAVAMQQQGANVDSAGPIAWNGAPVVVRVLAIKRGQRSFLETRLEPLREEDLYRRLVTLSNTLNVAHENPDNPGQSTVSRTILNGEIWENVTNGSIVGIPGLHYPSTNTDPVPDPDVDSYLAQHLWDSATTPLPHNALNGDYSLDATGYPNNVRFYRTTGTLGDAGWSLNKAGQSYTIRVKGRVIWMFDHGVRFDGGVQVQHDLIPTPEDALIIVARHGPITTEDDAFKGIAFKSALTTPLLSAIPVILVSDRMVSIEHKVITNELSRVNNLSIYARDCYLLGPYTGNVNMTLTHPNLPGPLSTLIDLLYELRFLPNATVGIGGTLPPIAGSWRDITESNPI